MVAMLTKAFGAQHLQLAEDVVQDTLLQACSSWMQGIPPNPVAWLYRVARHKAIDALRRSSFSQQYDFGAEASHHLLHESYLMKEGSDDALVSDDLLRMMYACSHPAIAAEGATALILKTLCGFSIAEIARAFLTTEANIAKRLYRAKEIFRTQELRLSIPSVTALQSRTDAMLRAIYLLFNEGYSATEQESVIRKDLMDEAMRLCTLLLHNHHTQQPAAYALMALMCFQASRSDSRLSPEGDIILLADQDRSTWDAALIALGNDYMDQSASGDTLSVYHLQAAIAWEHCNARSFDTINWTAILKYYDWLLALSPSPVTALHRAVAVLYAQGGAAAIEAMLEIEDREKLLGLSLYHAVLGECYAASGRRQEAAIALEQALALTHVPAEQALLRQKIAALFN
jgi:RNA polymerase sigma-70 factor (ECF subfamily)